MFLEPSVKDDCKDDNEKMSIASVSLAFISLAGFLLSGMISLLPEVTLLRNKLFKYIIDMAGIFLCISVILNSFTVNSISKNDYIKGTGSCGENEN